MISTLISTGLDGYGPGRQIALHLASLMAFLLGVLDSTMETTGPAVESLPTPPFPVFIELHLQLKGGRSITKCHVRVRR